MILSKLTLLATISDFIRDSDGEISGGRALIVLVLALAFIYIVLLYLLVKAVLFVATTLFVRGQGRTILGDGPVIRRETLYRCGARVIDYTVIVLIAAPLISILSGIGITSGSGVGASVLFFVGVSYFSGIQLAAGRTVGKALFGLQVVSTVGRRSAVQSAIREFVSSLFIFTVLFPISIYVMMKNEDNEQPADVVADTKVIRSGPAGVAGLSTLIGTGDANSVPLQGLRGALSRTNRTGDDGTSSVDTQIQDEGTETTLQTGVHNSDSADTTSSAGSGQSETTTDDQPIDSSGDTEVFNGKVCTDCGANISGAASFCPECGQDLS